MYKRQAQRYGNDARPRERFILTQTLVARTERVDAVAALAGRVGELVGAGVVLGHEGPEQGPQYLFTGLNAIKPPMLAEATAAARDAAAQFASDSGSRLAGLRRANQGVFVIQPRDAVGFVRETAQIDKTVRVVATLHYYLDE